jgi:tetratricopeptide (TPR) repeat protein
LSPGVPASARSLPSGPSRTDKTPASNEASGAFRLGVSYRNRGQYGQAVTEFQKALADQKRAARAALMLGLCYRDQNQLKEAIEAFKEGVHMPGISDPDLGELHYQLGRSYEQLGDTGEAIHFYQLALKPTGRFKDADSRIATLQGKSSRSLK